ncbi:hypothetical protein GCM10009872_32430 [Actinopolymorpha rutila]
MTVTHVDPRAPPPNVLAAPLVHGVDLVPESAQVGIGFLRMLPVPQELLDDTGVPDGQVLEYGQVPAAIESSRQLYPWNVAIARAAYAEIDEVRVTRLERTDPGGETTMRRSIHVRPVALTAHRPAQAFEMFPHPAVILLGPSHITQENKIGIVHQANLVTGRLAPPTT